MRAIRVSLQSDEQLEATKISSRTKAGLERVRAQGKTLGRPNGLEAHAATLQRLRAEGLSVRRIAAQLDLSPTTVQGYFKRLKEAHAKPLAEGAR